MTNSSNYFVPMRPESGRVRCSTSQRWGGHRRATFLPARNRRTTNWARLPILDPPEPALYDTESLFVLAELDQAQQHRVPW